MLVLSDDVVCAASVSIVSAEWRGHYDQPESLLLSSGPHPNHTTDGENNPKLLLWLLLQKKRNSVLRPQLPPSSLTA